MNFSDVVKQNTDEKYAKLASGKAERSTTTLKIASCDQYEQKRENLHTRLKKEEMALQEALKGAQAAKKAADIAAEEQRRKEEAQRREAERREAERKEAERQEAERKRKEEERRIAEEKREAERKRQAEERRIAEEKRKEEERLAAERRAAEEKRLAEERARQEEAERIRRKKQKTKKTIIAVAVLAVVILGIIIYTSVQNARYSDDNVSITVVEKYGENATSNKLYFTLVFEAENNGSVDIHQMVGNFKIFNLDGDCLLSETLTLNGTLKPDNILQYDVEISLSNIEKNIEIFETDLLGLKMTYQLTAIEFEGYKIKEYKNGDIKVINGDESNNENGSVNSNLRKKFDSILEAFQTADCFDSTYSEDLSGAVDKLSSLWNNIKSNKELLNELYTVANKYHENGQCEKAYYIFTYLETISYKDTSERARECYDDASTVSYDSSRPGKAGITIEYGCMVSAVEPGYDAYNKIQYMDEIVEIDGSSIKVTDPTNDIYNKLAGKKAGETIELGIYRNGSYMTVTIKLGYKYFYN